MYSNPRLREHGRFALGPRTLAELETYLKNHYEDLSYFECVICHSVSPPSSLGIVIPCNPPVCIRSLLVDLDAAIRNAKPGFITCASTDIKPAKLDIRALLVDKTGQMDLTGRGWL
jgi:hypothetical protein